MDIQNGKSLTQADKTKIESQPCVPAEGELSGSLFAPLPEKNSHTAPVNPEARPYEPGYDWASHGYDELDDHVEWGEHEGDYSIGGVLYCAHCHTPKQHVRDWQGKTYRFPIPCQCQKEALARQEQKQKRRKAMEKAMRYRELGFSDEVLKNWTFARDDGASPKYTAIMKRYVEHFSECRAKGQGLLLYGSCGSGKTFAAAAIANALIEQGIPCLVSNFDRLSDKLTAPRSQRTMEAEDLNKFELLVLDDLDAEVDNKYTDNMIFRIVDSRYRAGLPMIITTNLTKQDLLNPRSVAKKRIYDRILERCCPVEMNDANRRAKAMKNNILDMKQLLGI